jgi:Protein of unknown function (DUF2009)
MVRFTTKPSSSSSSSKGGGFMGGRRGGGRRGSGGGAGPNSSSSSASGSDVDVDDNGAEDDNDNRSSSNESKGSDEDEKCETSFHKNNSAAANTSSSSSLHAVADWAQHVPLRLNDRERHLLTVLEQTLHVSEYTDHVDVAASNTGYMGGSGMGFGGGGLYGNGGGMGNGAGRRGGAKARRILDGILEVCHIAVGLATASGLAVVSTTTTSSGANGDDKNHPNNNSDSQEVEEATATTTAATAAAVPYATREPAENAALFRSMFEVGRRNKVLNPSSMRTTYGKLMYLLQDAQNPTVAKSLGFRLHKPLLLVGPFLKKHHAFDLLHDPRLECAIQYVADRDAHGNKLDRTTLEAMVAGKHRVTLELVEAYSNNNSAHSESTLRPDDVKRVIESLADAVAYIESNVRPVQAMLQFLQHNFDRNHPHKGFSLALSGSSRSSSSLLSSTNSYYGRFGYGTSAYASGSNEGPTLSHSHPTQYMFVWQSLNLWCKVMRNMHKLWICADDDLLSTTSTYHLYNTGQGLNRVQNCPKVRAVMSSLLSQTQREAAAPWVGLSVIHLGDRDVPNALVFIDKYTQIPRFLTPIVQFVHALPELCSDPVLEKYVTAEFGSIDHLKLTVLSDYFKHGFDGSGDDGGSCIDGRLTSSWNWTSRIAKKRYYHAFMMSGFQGFDGDFR